MKPKLVWYCLRHDWGLWRWQVDYQSDQPRGMIIGRWIRYCKHCAAQKEDYARQSVSLEKYRKRYFKKHPYLGEYKPQLPLRPLGKDKNE